MRRSVRLPTGFAATTMLSQILSLLPMPYGEEGQSWTPDLIVAHNDAAPYNAVWDAARGWRTCSHCMDGRGPPRTSSTSLLCESQISAGGPLDSRRG